MLKKNEIKKLGSKLGWKVAEVEFAVKVLGESRSIIDYREFLRICIEAKNPRERVEKVEQFLVKTVKGDLADAICKLLYIDPCFKALAFFNAYDLTHGLKRDISRFNIYFTEDKRSFLSWDYELILKIPKGKKPSKNRATPSTPSKPKTYILFEVPIKYMSFEDLTYKALDLLIRSRHHGTVQDMAELMLKVVSKVGFLAFNISMFRNLVTVYCYNPFYPEQGKETLKKLKDLFSPSLNRKEMIQKDYWFIYAAVTKLTKRGVGLRQSFRDLGKLLTKTAGTIQSRYFEKKKEAIRRNLSLNDVVDEYGLYVALDDL